jgi:hypothetical protein
VEGIGGGRTEQRFESRSLARDVTVPPFRSRASRRQESGPKRKESLLHTLREAREGVFGVWRRSGRTTDQTRWELLELMIPPHYRLGSTVVVRPSRFRAVLGSNPGLAILFSSYRSGRDSNGTGDGRDGRYIARSEHGGWVDSGKETADGDNTDEDFSLGGCRPFRRSLSETETFLKGGRRAWVLWEPGVRWAGLSGSLEVSCRLSRFVTDSRADRFPVDQ